MRFTAQETEAVATPEQPSQTVRRLEGAVRQAQSVDGRNGVTDVQQVHHVHFQLAAPEQGNVAAVDEHEHGLSKTACGQVPS